MNDTGEAQRARERSQGGRNGDPPWQKRPARTAASVERRWWEEGLSLAPPGGEDKGTPASSRAGHQTNSVNLGGLPPPPPPPPGLGLTARTTAHPAFRGNVPPSPAAATRWSASIAPPAPPAGTLATSETARIERLEQELTAARDEANALHEMLEDLPEIFERKFRQRLEAILERERLLLADNRLLRQQLFALLPASEGSNPTQPLLPAAPEAESPAARPHEPLRRLRERLRRFSTRLGR